MKRWIFSSLIALSCASSAFALVETNIQDTPFDSRIEEKQSTTNNATSPIKPFLAKYTALRAGKDVGEAKLQLSVLDNAQYELIYESNVSRFFLSDNRYEKTIFFIHEQNLIPHQYIYKRTGTGPDKSLSLEFDRLSNTIVVDDGDSMEWQGELDNQLFRIDLPQKLANGDMKASYDFINYRGQKRHYELEVVATDNLSLPYGNISALKVKINRHASSRLTYAWFAPGLSYNLVKLQQFKDDKEQGEIQLSSFSYL